MHYTRAMFSHGLRTSWIHLLIRGLVFPYIKDNLQNFMSCSHDSFFVTGSYNSFAEEEVEAACFHPRDGLSGLDQCCAQVGGALFCDSADSLFSGTCIQRGDKAGIGRKIAIRRETGDILDFCNHDHGGDGPDAWDSDKELGNGMVLSHLLYRLCQGGHLIHELMIEQEIDLELFLMIVRQAEVIEVGQPLLTEDVPKGYGAVVFGEKGVYAVFHSDGIADQSSPMAQEFFEFTGVNGWDIDCRDQICPEQLSEHVAIEFVVLDFGASDSLCFSGIGQDHLKAIAIKQIVKPVPRSGGFHNHFGGFIQSSEVVQDKSFIIDQIGSFDHLALFIYRGKKRCFLVQVDSSIIHSGYLLFLVSHIAPIYHRGILKGVAFSYDQTRSRKRCWRSPVS